MGASKVHRWLALLIGAQVIVWFTSGLVMALLPIDTVHGDHRIDRDAEPALSSAQAFAPVPTLLTAAGSPVRQLQHRVLLGRPVVEAQLASGGVRLLDARTATVLPPIDASTAGAIARKAYRGKSATSTVERVERASPEYRGALPAWRTSFADDDATRIYVSAETGRLTSVRTGTWRLYDFFWGLHIMDWTQHERFNTPWLKAFAAGGLVFGVAGAILLFMRWPRRRRKSRGMRQGAA
ncbi:PepSY domain-containing protein [Sphingomonas hominis]|uniref:PepSY domain-containing protein n=1 Tax=Sphingomonas hominis TaxID=2741495 RepID=UPI0031B57528